MKSSEQQSTLVKLAARAHSKSRFVVDEAFRRSGFHAALPFVEALAYVRREDLARLREGAAIVLALIEEDGTKRYEALAAVLDSMEPVRADALTKAIEKALHPTYGGAALSKPFVSFEPLAYRCVGGPHGCLSIARDVATGDRVEIEALNEGAMITVRDSAVGVEASLVAHTPETCPLVARYAPGDGVSLQQLGEAIAGVRKTFTDTRSIADERSLHPAEVDYAAKWRRARDAAHRLEDEAGAIVSAEPSASRYERAMRLRGEAIVLRKTVVALVSEEKSILAARQKRFEEAERQRVLEAGREIAKRTQ